ncbi:hypothetical protein HPB51_023018 [Rhipicephalus microplus]|uniref:F-box/LRR-repeat protein 15-like leucin rich repeat domain-containing protein n=1 Tax=Rhipicephalus microplus TaxID=6941 RepID=A0A9J6D7D4_RHIMP|nr:hypothetical protein HPB51_023018 [Rhipicephalus microplus]
MFGPLIVTGIPNSPQFILVELQYEHHVYPATVTVFETYNPGSVVRILAYDRLKNRWKELWVGKPTKGAEACAWPRPLSLEDTFVTRLFWKVCYDHVFYRCLDLQPYWEKIDDNALEALQKRCVTLEKLNLSWCGAAGYLSAEAFVSFMEVRGELLQCLCLSSCPFVDNECLKVIADYCPNLTELELKGCCNPLLNRLGFLQISHLSKLVWLDLCRTEIEMFSLISIIRNCNKLRHLSLGSCPVVNNYDDIALEISTYLGNLRSLDLYRARTLSSVGANLFARSCPHLVSLDLGWWRHASVSYGTYLSAVSVSFIKSVLCDTDLYAIAKYCHDLEHLDILGSAEASSTGVIQ